MLGGYAARRLEEFASTRLLSALWNSVFVSGSTAIVAVLLAFLLAYAARTARSRLNAAAGRFASFGYGVPGTVLAMGVLIPLANFDNAVDAFLRANIGISTGLLLSAPALPSSMPARCAS